MANSLKAVLSGRGCWKKTAYNSGWLRGESFLGKCDAREKVISCKIYMDLSLVADT